MKGTIEIRTASVMDAQMITQISRETFYDTFAEFNTRSDMDKFLSEQFTSEQLIDEVGKNGNIFLLAIKDDDVAGYIFLKENSHADLALKNVIEISRLYVRRAFIGTGTGKLLMQTAIAHAKAKNKIAIWLGVWEKNQRAIDFYQSFGFEKFSEQDFVLGDDLQRDWTMVLRFTI